MASTSDRLYIARSGTSATNTTAVATNTTPKTVVGVFGTANTTISVARIRVSFNSVTAADAPATIEVGVTTAAGTSTAFTPVQLKGRTLASACAAGYNHSAEPTYTRITDPCYAPVNNGFLEWWYPLGFETQCDISQGIAIRVTSPQAQSCLASIMYSE